MAASTTLQVLVSPLLGTVFDNLSSLLQTEFALLSGLTGELEKLFSTLSTINDVIEDAELTQLRNKPIRNWLRKLKDVAYDAEDILDEFATIASLNTKTMDTTHSSNNVQVLSASSCFSFKHVLFRRSIAKRIRKVQVKFDEIAKERLNFHLAVGNIVEPRLKQHRETSSFIAEEEIYGREDDKDYIVNLLIDNIQVGLLDDGDSQGGDASVSVCVIHGMGGLGKTTLAKMVYSDGRIVDHFQVRCWVCVSDNFDPKSLLRATIESLGGFTSDVENLDPLQRHLQKKLSGKRFLVVLDDVWNDDQTKWDVLKSSFRCGRRGSLIIVTTRLEKVVSVMSTLPVYRPKYLSKEDCWSLFKHRAFDMSKDELANYSKLEAAGKEIVKKCGGVPLAAKVLGGLLRFTREEDYWLFVRDNEIWKLPSDKEDPILSILRLSYDHLPSHLRACFAYCSIFPKDYKLDRKELIYLWMANGFLRRKQGGIELEVIGNDFFNDLLWRSFFQDIEKDEFGNVLSCKMHDLMHDLACSIMGEECSGNEFDEADATGKRSTRHLSFISFDSPSASSHHELFLLKPQTKLRNLLLKYKPFSKDYLRLNSKEYQKLRALDLSQSNISKLLNSICNLKHLRYLNLSFTSIRAFPNKSFYQLRNLQTLKLNDCYSLQILPEDLAKLTSLRHLYIERCHNLSRMPKGMRKLVCLQTLSIFIVGTGSESGIEQLQGLNNLGGELTIKAMEHVRNANDAKKANLMRKKNLRNLNLVWSRATQVQQNNGTNKKQEEVMEFMGEGLQYLSNMKKLGIEWYGGAKFPSWMRDLSCFSNLIEISVTGCRSWEHLPPLGQLPILKVLQISHMSSVKYVRNEFYLGNQGGHQGSFFPSLEDLTLSEMPNLEEWSSPSSNLEKGIREDVQYSSFPRLRSLTISKCHKLRRCLPLPLSLRTLELTECRETVLIKWLESPLPYLSTLLIVGLDDLISFPVSQMKKFHNLAYLRITHCHKLRILQKELIENLTSLTALYIRDCPELEISIDVFSNLAALRVVGLHCLPKMASLPVMGSKPVSAILERLSISGCPSLTTLPWWMSNLTALRRLSIVDCTNLKSLPEGLKQLTTLSCLVISRCHSDLHKRYEKHRGDDWHKIAHIQYFTNEP